MDESCGWHGARSKGKVESAHETMISFESATARDQFGPSTHVKRSAWFTRAQSFGIPTTSSLLATEISICSPDIDHVVQAKHA